MLKNSGNNGMEEIGIVTTTPELEEIMILYKLLSWMTGQMLYFII